MSLSPLLALDTHSARASHHERRNVRKGYHARTGHLELPDTVTVIDLDRTEAFLAQMKSSKPCNCGPIADWGENYAMQRDEG